MDAEAIIMIIQNMLPTYDDAYARCLARMRDIGALPGMANDKPEADYDTAGEIGDVIEAMCWDYAKRENRISDDERTLTSALFATMLGHIDWREVGSYYYGSVRERFSYKP